MPFRLIGLFVCLLATSIRAQEVDVYRDVLGAGRENWSWSTAINLAATSPVHGSTNALTATYTARLL